MTTAPVSTDLALLLDVGSAWAKVGVIGRVRGRWRLVAHAAQPTAWGPTELRRTLVDQLRAGADPRLADDLDDLISGANRIECHTAQRPARLAIVAVSRELSGLAARRAAEAAGWHLADVVTLDDGRSLADRIGVLQAVEADAWLVAGGFDGTHSARALEAAALVAAARRHDGGPVVWAGSADLADEVIGFFEPGAASAVANPRPDARREDTGPLRDRLAELVREVSGPEEDAHLASVAFPRAIGTLAAAAGMRILGIDLGARSATRALAEPDGSVESRSHAGGGLAGTILGPGAPGRVMRLAGDAGDDAAVADLLQTLRARPATLPQTPEELSATQAAARVQVAALVEDDPPGPVDVLVGSGRTIAMAPHPAQAAGILLDAVRPLGVTQLAIDQASLLGPLGSLPDDEIGEGLALLGDDLLVPLGTAVVSRGGEDGRIAMRVTVHRSGWPTTAPIEVRAGQIHVVPLARGQEADVTIEPAPGVSLGVARRSPRVIASATGGSVGLILDARGIPLGLPRRGDERRTTLAVWREALHRDAAAGTERVA
jgi:MutL protein